MKILITLLVAVLVSCTSVQGLRNGYVSTKDGNKTIVANRTVYFHSKGIWINKSVTVDGDGIHVEKDSIPYTAIESIHLEK